MRENGLFAYSLWSEQKVVLYMRATFLYRIFVCFVLEVLLYFFFIFGHCIFYCFPMLLVVCCVLYSVTLVCLCTLFNGQVYCILAHSLPRFGGVRICQVIKLFIYCDPDCVSILIIFTDCLQHSNNYLAALFSPFLLHLFGPLFC